MQFIQIYETIYQDVNFGYVKNFDNDNNKLYIYILENNKFIKFLEINKDTLSILNTFMFSLSNQYINKIEILKRFNSYSIFYQDNNNKFIYRELFRNIQYDLTNDIKRILYNNNFKFIGISKHSINLNFTNIIEKHFAIFEVIKDNNLIYWKVELIFDNNVENLRDRLGFIPQTKIFLNIDENYKPEVMLNLDNNSIKDIKFDSSSPTFFIEV